MSIYSIEGNIGSGKSTLVKMMKEQTKSDNVIFVQEPVDIWNTIKDDNNETILEKYYKDQEKYAFSFQIMAYISRISILRKTIKKHPNAIIITERSVLVKGQGELNSTENFIAKRSLLKAESNKISSGAVIESFFLV